MSMTLLFLSLLLCSFLPLHNCKNDLLVFTVATRVNDGFKRFQHSATKYGLPLKVLGVGETWKGGDIQRFPGGGHKVNLLSKALASYRDSDDVIMFVDSYDVVFTAGADEILAKFKKFQGAEVVFSAEGFCWPDSTLESEYPVVKMNEKRYLNSGGFIGKASVIYKIVTSSAIEDTDDDQLFYTKIFLNKSLREKYKIRLDNRGEIFQNLNGALDEVSVKFKGEKSFLYNMKTGTKAAVVHGNGPIKVEFNNLANYLADQWTPTSGCVGCAHDTISLQGLNAADYPRVLLGIFFDTPTPFVDGFFRGIAAVSYPKGSIDLFIAYATDYHAGDAAKYVADFGKNYRSVTIVDSATNHFQSRNMALTHCQKVDCDYAFLVNGLAHLENAVVLTSLIEQNRSVIAPMMSRPGKLWSNFWGGLSREGFYKRSADYMDIVSYKKSGVWNVPFITDAILVHSYRLEELKGGFVQGELDADMAFAKSCRDLGIFMYVDNREHYGSLVDNENFETSHLHNDMFSLLKNKYFWEEKYLHADYRVHLDKNYKNEEVCTDVYTMPLMTETFTTHLVEEAEHFGQWSSGKNQDSRLPGGYENVPTVDIHMNQIGFAQQWLQVLKDYVGPFSEKLYTGYSTEAHATMNFIVRYKPTEQDRLRPHHDTSTYTINVALNRHGVDFQGGGVRFTRYDCKYTTCRLGWMLMHPGRLTHQHEGLQTTNGTRYIMISFIDP